MLSSAVRTGTNLLIHFGGLSGATYDAEANTWVGIADAPEPADEIGAVAIGSQLAVRAKEGGVLLLFNPKTGRWRKSSPGPGARLAPAGLHIVAWGPQDGAIYEPATDTWIPIPRSPLRPRDDAAVVWAAGRVVVWGGQDTSGASQPELFDDGAVYDPAAGTWAPMARSPIVGRAFRFGGAAPTGSRVLFVDGATYDPVADRWEKTAPPPFRPGPVTVWTGNRLYAFNGPDGAALAYDANVDRWARIPSRRVSVAASTDEGLVAVAPGPGRYRP